MSGGTYRGPSTQNYATPARYVRALEDELGRPFALDVCAEAWNAKAERYLDVQANGLTSPWSPLNFCNPPYDNQQAWLARAAWWSETHGHTSACLVRASIDTRYWFRLVVLRATCDFFFGRIPYIDPVTRKEKRGSTFASAVVLYGPQFEPGVVRWRDAESGRLIDVKRARELRDRELLA